MIKENRYLTFFLSIVAGAIFVFGSWLLPEKINANQSLRRIHNKIGLTCKNCHHNETRYCGKCHMAKAKKTEGFSSLVGMEKKIHKNCRSCHIKKNINGKAKKRIRDVVRNNSNCKNCHID